MYAYIFGYFGDTLSIKRTSSTEINKTFIIPTLLFSCRFSSLNLQDGSSAVLIQVRRLQRLRRNCISDQNLHAQDLRHSIRSAPFISQLRNTFFLLLSSLRGFSFLFPAVPLYIRQILLFLPADWLQTDPLTAKFFCKPGFLSSRAF